MFRVPEAGLTQPISKAGPTWLRFFHLGFASIHRLHIALPRDRMVWGETLPRIVGSLHRKRHSPFGVIARLGFNGVIRCASQHGSGSAEAVITGTGVRRLAVGELKGSEATLIWNPQS